MYIYKKIFKSGGKDYDFAQNRKDSRHSLIIEFDLKSRDDRNIAELDNKTGVLTWLEDVNEKVKTRIEEWHKFALSMGE